MDYKKIETSREARLWLGQIIIPTITGVMILCPEIRMWTTDKITSGFRKIRNKLSKK